MCPTPLTDFSPPDRPSRLRAYTAFAARALCLVFIASLLAGCLPSRVTIDLAPRDGKLDESVVDDDGLSAFGVAPKVAMIDLSGLITEQPTNPLFDSSASMVDRFVAKLDKAADDPRVVAVVLRINSPGGTVSASETLANEIERFRSTTGKPVVASFAEVAASGGYYTALACDRIVAQPSSITGSIGVVIQTFNLSRGMSMIGVSGRAVTSAENKDIANPFEEIDEEHYAILQGMVDEFYTSFRDRVLDRRDIDESDVRRVTDGRVFTGTTAMGLGLVDELGGVREAFAIAKADAGVERARLVKYHREGVTLTTPYARAQLNGIQTGDDPGPMGWLSGNLRPGAYYVWTAGSVR